MYVSRRYFASFILTLAALRDVILQLYVLDERFQLYCEINWCFMHQATIGLFGHLVKAVKYNVEITLRNDSYVQGKTHEGGPVWMHVLPAARVTVALVHRSDAELS